MDGAYQLNVVQNQTKLVTFCGGARTQERPEGLPGSIFQGSGPLTKVVQITAEQTTFWGVGAPERPEGHLGPIFHNSGPLTEMLQKEPKLRTFRGAGQFHAHRNVCGHLGLIDTRSL